MSKASGSADVQNNFEARYERLVARGDKLKDDTGHIEAELAAHKRSLKKLMDDCRAAGFDPDNLKEDIRRRKEVMKVKLDTFEAELDAAEKIVKPLIDEIRRR